MTMRNGFQQAVPLTHPLWWGGLVVLIVNDHLLKTAALLPRLVTGKLSDCAWLVVASLVLVAIVRPRFRGGRALCFAAVAGFFAAINLSPAFAGTIEASLTWAGVPTRTWPDPTDLIALIALVPAWSVAGRPSAVAPGGSRTRKARLVRPAAIVLGSLACIATSPPPTTVGDWRASAFLLNGSGRSLDVRVEYFTGQVDCSTAAQRPGEVFAPEAFTEGVTVLVRAGHTIPLDSESLYDALEQSGGDSAEECQAVVIRVDGLEETIAFFELESPDDVPAEIGQDAVVEDVARVPGLELVVRGAGLEVELHNGMQADALVDELPVAGCQPPEAIALQAAWDNLPAEVDMELVAVSALPDDCLALDLALSGQQFRFYLCMPSALFPFDVGDVVVRRRSSTPQLLLEREATAEAPEATLEVYSSVGSVRSGPLSTVVRTNNCGERHACGGFLMGASVELNVAGRIEALRPGDELVLPDVGETGGTTTFFLGRAFSVASAPPSCPFSALGPVIDAAVVRVEALEE